MATVKKPAPQTNSDDQVKKKAGAIEAGKVAANNAKKAFSNFSLGKSSEQKKARHYVEQGQTLKERQKEIIGRQLEDQKPTGPGLTILVSNPKLLKLQDGKMELSDLISGMERAKTGYAFYATGTSVSNQIDIHNRAGQIILDIKKGGSNNG